MKVATAFIASCSAVLYQTVPGDGAACFMDCQKALYEVYMRCGLEWGWGNDDFDR